MLADPIQVVVRVAQALTSAGIPYLVGGSLASSQYGIPRSTQDVDLIADLQPKHVPALLAALGDEFYVDAEMVQESIRHRSSFNAIYLQTMYKVDVFLPRAGPWARQELARRRTETVGSGGDAVSLYFCSPEDIVLHKLDWFRLGGGVSDRQWNDILGVIKVQGTALEPAYLKHWASELGLTDLLERALREAGVTL